MEEILLMLEIIQRNGLAVEEATNDELIAFIAELKYQVNEVIEVVENKIKSNSYQVIDRYNK